MIIKSTILNLDITKVKKNLIKLIYYFNYDIDYI